jgi:hypothetical protein
MLHDPIESTVKPASDNPWFVLMTLFGNSEARKNRAFWNGWAYPALPRRVLETAAKVTSQELRPLSADEHEQLASQFHARLGTSAPLPSPTELIDLSGIEVDEPFQFRNLVFPGDFRLNGSIFKNRFEIQSSFFSRNIISKGCTFASDAAISDSFIRGTATLRESVVCGSPVFRGNIYRKSISFRDSRFIGDALFLSSKYMELGSFRNVEFERAAIFDKSQFLGETTFRACLFSGQTSFKSCAFKGNVDFSETQYKSITSFTGSQFSGHPPAFFGAMLYDDIDWTEVSWPSAPNTDDDAADYRRRYERLKLLMGKLNMYQEEQRFLRSALRCREIEDPRSAATWISRAFRWASDYGWSIVRPVFWLSASIAVGWGAIWAIENGGQPSTGHQALDLGQALGVSFSNVFSFLGLGNAFLEEEMDSLSSWSQIVSGMQMFLGPILLFLLGLALRNRFRIR